MASERQKPVCQKDPDTARSGPRFGNRANPLVGVKDGARSKGEFYIVGMGRETVKR